MNYKEGQLGFLFEKWWAKNFGYGECRAANDQERVARFEEE